MVAIDEILLRERTGEECGGDSDTCTGSRVHHHNAENRAPVTRNHRSAPILGRRMEQDPAQYINGANTYQFVDSSPVGNVDASGKESGETARSVGGALLTPVVPGSEFLEAANPLPFWLQWQLNEDIQERMEHDMSSCPPIDPWKDPLFLGLFNWQQGSPLTPSEHQAVQGWLNQNGSTGFWPWLFSKL